MACQIIVDQAEIVDGMGEPPVMVSEAEHCVECHQTHEMEKCPKCGSWIQMQYGMMFGGMGLAKWCRNDDCDWFYKDLEPMNED